MLCTLADYDGGYHSEAVIDETGYNIFIKDRNKIAFMCDCAANCELDRFFLYFKDMLSDLGLHVNFIEEELFYFTVVQDGCITFISYHIEDDNKAAYTLYIAGREYKGEIDLND